MTRKIQVSNTILFLQILTVINYFLLIQYNLDRVKFLK